MPALEPRLAAIISAIEICRRVQIRHRAAGRRRIAFLIGSRQNPNSGKRLIYTAKKLFGHCVAFDYEILPCKSTHFFSIFSPRATILEMMKEYDDGSKLIQEFWKQAVSSQIGVLDAMANAVDNLPQEMQGGCLREMCKANAAFMTLYFRALEETGGQLAHMQSDALRRCSDALKTVLTKMESADGPCEAEPNKS